MDELVRRLEALFLTAPRPIATAELAVACDCGDGELAAALEAVASEYAPGRHGVELREVAGGFTFAVAEDCTETVRRFTGLAAPEELTPALLETLAVVAYLEPVTRSGIADVRGVSSEWALSALEERGLVEERGRAETPGSPIIYGTTDRFLKLFGLRSRDDLPPLDEFELAAADVDEIRARLLRNAARREA